MLSLCFLIRQSSEKITPVEGDKIFTQDDGNAEVLYTFFTNAIKNLKILGYEEVKAFAEKMAHPILKAIFKYSKRPNITAINNATSRSKFQFFVLSLMMIVDKKLLIKDSKQILK